MTTLSSQINNRLTDKEGDALVKDSKEKYKQKHEDQWESKKESQGRRLRGAEGKTWEEIIFDGVPYDVIAGSKDLGLGLSGQNHRFKTLGHDPVLGWFFGTINIPVAALAHNPNYVDLGGLFVTLLPHLFTDIRFITRIKQEFIQDNLDRELQEQLDELDSMMFIQ